MGTSGDGVAESKQWLGGEKRVGWEVWGGKPGCSLERLEEV